MKVTTKKKRVTTPVNKTEGKHKPLVMELLEELAEKNEWTPTQLATELGISYSYLAQLRNGSAKVKEMSLDVARRVSKLLGFPLVVTQLITEQLLPEDFYQKPQSIDESLDLALRYMQRDKSWGEHLSNKIFEADKENKFALVRSYEQATGRVLIPTRVTMETILRDYIELTENKPRR